MPLLHIINALSQLASVPRCPRRPFLQVSLASELLVYHLLSLAPPASPVFTVTLLLSVVSPRSSFPFFPSVPQLIAADGCLSLSPARGFIPPSTVIKHNPNMLASVCDTVKR